MLFVHSDRERLPLEEKVAFLSSPASYPAMVESVEVIRTHMSVVFLAGERVFKLKKPIHAPRLDFTSLAGRRRACEEEVRLNRRLAGDVYLGTVPLVAPPEGGLHLVLEGEPGAGEVVDWLVHMRRLPAARMLDALIRGGALQSGDVDRAARKLAHFYRSTPPITVGPSAFRKRLRSAIIGNGRLLKSPTYGLPVQLIEDTAGAQLSLLERGQALLDGRGLHVVEGHGDLRPEHVCLVYPEPVIFDCLEFDRELRLLDPAEELAFLAMECERLGAPQIEDVLFGVYGELTGDRPPGKLVRFYKAHRACCRAVQAAWHLDDGHAGEAGRWVGRAVEYLRYADVLLP